MPSRLLGRAMNTRTEQTRATPKTPRPARTRRPRVLHTVVDGPWGATRLAETLALEQARRGEFEVAVAFRALRRPPPQRAAQFARLGCSEFFLPGNPKPWLVMRLARLLREWQPDILFAHGYTLHLWARYAALLAGTGTVVQVEHNREHYSWRRRLQVRLLNRHTSRIVCVSPSVRENLASLRAPSSLLEVIPNGIPLDRYPAPDFSWAGRDIPLAMVARFSEQKDQATAIRALGLLRNQGVDTQLHLAGAADDGDRAQQCRALARELGLEEQVHFLGDVPAVPALLQRTRVLVHSTHYEGLPLAVLEGMAAGCAVVASAVPGVVDFVRDNENGLLVPEGDATRLADRLAAVLNSPELALRLARQGRAAVERDHTVGRMTDRYDRLVRTLLAPA